MARATYVLYLLRYGRMAMPSARQMQVAACGMPAAALLSQIMMDRTAEFCRF